MNWELSYLEQVAERVHHGYHCPAVEEHEEGQTRPVRCRHVGLLVECQEYEEAEGAADGVVE